MNKKTIVALMVVAIIGVGGFVYMSPWLALRDMQSAIEAKDVARLEKRIDFDKLRGDLRSEMKAAMAAQAVKEKGAGGALGAAFAGMLIDQMIDAMVTPAGLRQLLDKEQVGGGQVGGGMLGGGLAGAAAAGGAKVKRSLENAKVERTGLSEFRLRNADDPKSPILHFRRDGFAWKLDGIDLPPDVFAK